MQKASNGELGYMHITAMSSNNTGQFDKYWRAFRDRKGIIIDVRGNGGGWTEYFIIDKLERKMTAQNVLRGMVPFRYPGSVTTGPIAVLTNEYNGSDGEAFLEHFRARKLGTVIGVPSWGGLVGILNGQTTIDNGTVQQSNNAFYNEKGQWLIENHGVDPDILLDNDPASASAGRDAQLEKAIEVLLKQIKEKPFTWPPVPKYPITIGTRVRARSQKGPLIDRQKQEAEKLHRCVLLASGFWLLLLASAPCSLLLLSTAGDQDADAVLAAVVRGPDVRNRVAMPPMWSGKATPEGFVTPAIVEYHRVRAAAGTALVIVEHAFVHPQGRHSSTQLGVHDDACIDGLARLAGAIRAEGAVACLQISHAGARASTRVTGPAGRGALPRRDDAGGQPGRARGD